MELAWMMLANHAEAPNGLLYISGGSWDVVNVERPLPADAPRGVVTVLQGVLVIRLEFHHTETGNEYPFGITIVDEDGNQVGQAEGALRVERQPDNPATWSQGANIIIPLHGLPIPRFGTYRISLQVNREYKGDIPFRVVQRY